MKKEKKWYWLGSLYEYGIGQKLYTMKQSYSGSSSKEIHHKKITEWAAIKG